MVYHATDARDLLLRNVILDLAAQFTDANDAGDEASEAYEEAETDEERARAAKASDAADRQYNVSKGALFLAVREWKAYTKPQNELDAKRERQSQIDEHYADVKSDEKAESHFRGAA